MSNGAENVQMNTASRVENRLLSFSLGTEEFAISLLGVKEVIAVPEITGVPLTPPHFLGIMNLRGQVISVVDFRLKLNLKAAANNETAIIICDLEPLVLGVVVDAINAVISPRPEDVSDKPDVQSSRNTDYITGVYRRDKRLVLLLDLAKALGVEDLRLAAQQIRNTKAA